MTGIAKTAEKYAEPFGKSTKLFPLPLTAGGVARDAYGRHVGEDTSEGFIAGREKKLANEQATQIENDKAAAKAAREADDAAALEKRYSAQRDLLNKRGRRASILSSSQGVTDPLGVPGQDY